MYNNDLIRIRNLKFHSIIVFFLNGLVTFEIKVIRVNHVEMMKIIQVIYSVKHEKKIESSM